MKRAKWASVYWSVAAWAEQIKRQRGKYAFSGALGSLAVAYGGVLASTLLR